METPAQDTLCLVECAKNGYEEILYLYHTGLCDGTWNYFFLPGYCSKNFQRDFDRCRRMPTFYFFHSNDFKIIEEPHEFENVFMAEGHMCKRCNHREKPFLSEPCLSCSQSRSIPSNFEEQK